MADSLASKSSITDALKLLSEEAIREQCRNRTNQFIDDIFDLDHDKERHIPSDVRALCFQFYHETNAAVCCRTETELEKEIRQDLMEHIERGHPFISITKDHPYDMVAIGHLDFWAALNSKLEGNEYYQKRSLDHALSCFIRMQKHLGLIDSKFVSFKYPMMREKMDKYALISLKNISEIYRVTQKYDECVALCDEVLSRLPTDIKSLFRRGWSYRKLGKLDLALNDFEREKSLLEPMDANDSLFDNWPKNQHLRRARRIILHIRETLNHD